MELRHLKYFVALAEELHFHRAADRLAISQPPLSTAIKQLEEELGTSLFQRSTKAVALTSAGAAFYPEAVRLLGQLEAACAVAREVGAGRRGLLKLGFVGGMVLRGLPETLEQYRDEANRVTVSLREMSSADQIAAIAHGQLAGGFLHAGVLPTGMASMIIGDEPFVACVPENHPLAGLDRIETGDLFDEDMILFTRDVSPGYYDSVTALCGEAGFSPRVRHHVTHWLTALLLISRGVGIAILPDAFRNVSMEGIRFLNLTPSKVRSVAYFVWAQSNDDPALKEFVRYARERLGR
ncbi:LysR family transcriptional regulator [Cupriavidus sp. D384]|uniref:LysR family transcriptional regulator n=1 Tax=Cupriavidus sp. D384 TaxID=1538095 RepID=UPI00082F7833|nr:LysR family transcriptional regulator [Cupriavidus sp. D384]